MNITLQETAPLQNTLTIEVGADDYNERVRKSLADMSRKAQMPGFRPGKVPAGLLRKMYGGEVLREQLNKILQESLDTYLKENNISLLGYPLPIPVDYLEFDPDKGDPFTFSFELGRQPEIQVNLKVSGIQEYQVELDDTYLDKEIRLLRNRFGKMTNTEVAEAGDYLYGQIEEVDNTGNVVESGIRFRMTLNPLLIDKLPSANFPAGVKVGDQVALNPDKLMTGEKKKAMLCNMPLSRYRKEGKGKQFRMVVEKINHYEAAEVNEDFFKKVFPGKDTPENETDFRNKLRESIQDYLNSEASKFFFLDLQAAMINAHSFELPAPFLKKWLLDQEENRKKGTTPEQIEQDFPVWEMELRWNLIRNAIQRHFDNMTVTEDEIRQEARNRALKMFGDLDETQAEAFVPYFLQNQESYDQMFESLLQEKLMGKLKEELSISAKKISASEFDVL